jgi:hypothetical protein
MHRASGRKDIAQRFEAGIRVGQVVEHTGADDLFEAPPELPDLFDREPMEIEISQAIFFCSSRVWRRLTSLMSIAVT